MDGLPTHYLKPMADNTSNKNKRRDCSWLMLRTKFVRLGRNLYDYLAKVYFGIGLIFQETSHFFPVEYIVPDGSM